MNNFQPIPAFMLIPVATVKFIYVVELIMMRVCQIKMHGMKLYRPSLCHTLAPLLICMNFIHSY